ncbi:MAG: hypothetical protein H7061_10890 [Bdellovibrionaceae bacterium]|nr:hypothetical protein [Bdellovibrio sp.]
MKLRMKLLFTSFISAFSTLVVSPVLYAETLPQSLPAQAVAFIPFAKLISKVKETFSTQSFNFSDSLPGFQSQSSDGRVQVVSERIDLAVQLQMKSISNAQPNALNLQMQLQNASAAAHNLNLVIAIRQDIGFGVATMTYNMQCQEAQLQLNNRNSISADVLFQQGHATSPAIVWDLSNTEISTTLVGCNEIPGLEDEIKVQIKNLIQQSFILDGIKNLVNANLDKVINEKLGQQIEAYAKNLNLSQAPSHSFDEKSNLWLFSSADVVNLFQASELAELGRSTTPSLLVKKSGIETMLKTALNQYLASATISSKTTSGLDRLTCSRFVQFFVWPALRSLNRCFEMTIQNRVKKVAITNLKNLEMSIELQSWAAGDNKNLAYASGLVSIKPLEVSAYLSNFDLRQDPGFTSWSGRSSYISSNTLKKALQSLMNTTLEVLSKKDAFGFFKQKTSVKLISPDAIIMSLN